MLLIDKFKQNQSSEYSYKNVLVVAGYVYGEGKVNINWSDIKDRLIRLTARYTDYYGSDVIISIIEIENYLENLFSNRNEKSYLFGFREDGVDDSDSIVNETEEKLNFRYRKIFKLDLKFTNEMKTNFGLHFYEVGYSNY